MGHLRDRIKVVESITSGALPLPDIRRIKKEEKVRIDQENQYLGLLYRY